MKEQESEIAMCVLQVLKVREDHVKAVLDEARNRLSKVSDDKKFYRDILHQLILQALFQVMENKVIIRCREADVGLVNDILPDVVNEYNDKMHQDLQTKIDSTYLPANIAGGVEVIALNGRIKVLSCSSIPNCLFGYVRI